MNLSDEMNLFQPFEGFGQTNEGNDANLACEELTLLQNLDDNHSSAVY